MFNFLKGLFGKNLYAFEIHDKNDEDLFRKMLKAVSKYLPSDTMLNVVTDANNKDAISKFSFKITDRSFKKMCKVLSKKEKMYILPANKNKWFIIASVK